MSADASQFTRFKRVNAVNRSDSQSSDSKSVNRLTAYTTRLSDTAVLTSFLPTPTLKSAQPATRTPKSILGKIGLIHQRCG
jgi:hypothetical protein